MPSAATTFSATTTGDEVVSAYSDRVRGHTFLITGASPASIGATTAYSLAKAHPEILILVARTPEKLTPVVEEIKAINPAIQVIVVGADLSSIVSVRDAATTILGDERVKHIDVIINNAGIMVGPHRTSVDGVELQFASCHVGHFLLTNMLVPRLRASAEGGRIVNVASSGHRFAQLRDSFDPLLEHTPYEEWISYGFSKLSNILYSKALAARGFISYSLHPGSIRSGLQQNLTSESLKWALETSAKLEFTEYNGFYKSQEQGCSTQLLAALVPTGEFENGTYFSDCQPHVPSNQAQDKDGVLAKQLWVLSEKLVGQRFD